MGAINHPHASPQQILTSWRNSVGWATAYDKCSNGASCSQRVQKPISNYSHKLTDMTCDSLKQSTEAGAGDGSVV